MNVTKLCGYTFLNPKLDIEAKIIQKIKSL